MELVSGNIIIADCQDVLDNYLGVHRVQFIQITRLQVPLMESYIKMGEIWPENIIRRNVALTVGPWS